ncbi:Alpha-1,2-mannosyltransferase ALG9 [Eumeta japonica]|uniref:Mannosyltransferase n=1 Tax=Eumeta variegata TaxID=151549 RepID=A0A4C1XQZ0_EUMVA|nr:Alpha-1,2-mannosyltransferase ALG9 [Eumeta japonica]
MSLTARQRSIHSKNGKKYASFNKGKKGKKPNEGEYLVTNAPTDLRNISYPGGAVALGLLLTARVAAALWGHIGDCDETYNYWEPLHYLIYGSGLQTWEYSPVYAIRSYVPLWLFAIPAKLLAIICEPILLFYLIKSLLGILSAVAEFMFYKAICFEFGVHVGRTWLALSLPAAGCFAAAPAMLPSAWSNALSTAALACWWRKRNAAAILLTAANAILSWPFAALLGIPIAIDMLLLKRHVTDFFKWSAVALMVFLGPMVLVDSWHYGRLVIAPWNIVAYNIFTEHGPDLYGVEPWTFYFINGFLNFNLVWVLALSCPLLLAACRVLTSRAAPRPAFCCPYWLSLMPLYLWLAVFMLQPHKEERFLYPVYSMIVLCGAISLDCLQKMWYALSCELRTQRRRHYLTHTASLFWLCVLAAGFTGLSRIVALYNNYHAPMSILNSLPQTNADEILYVCYGKDWYRAPSSFHLPDEGYRVRFIKSQFKGQLPAPFNDNWNATRLIQPHFNDHNEESSLTYLKPSQCLYLVDSDIGEANSLEPRYASDNTTWEIIDTKPILDAEKSHKIFRAFYLPFISNKHCVFANLYLLKNRVAA